VTPLFASTDTVRGASSVAGSPLRLTYVGGPTALIEWGGLRLLTDPTFDAAPTTYPLLGYALKKIGGPVISAEEVGPIDLVLLSHEHHLDNLDRSGRAVAERAACVITTEAGATQLGANAIGLAPWMSVDVPAPHGRTLRVEATPARHGPAGGDRGPVIGFILSFTDDSTNVVYISGDTVWYDGTEEVARRHSPKVAILFLGAARLAVAGLSPLTLTAAEAVIAAGFFARAVIVPLHFEGWAHLSESRTDVENRFREAGMSSRITWPEPGRALELLGASPVISSGA
jgi:L-ascorbate metabolism protein UlaG (beta-lactamase superfamily)